MKRLITRIGITFCVVWSAAASAQKISHYDGYIPLIEGDSAHVRYDYYESKGKRILQGDYQLQASTSGQHDSLTFEKIVWGGNFSNNRRDGAWNYQYQQHKVQILDIEDFTLKSSLSSRYDVLDAAYNRGIPEGQWTFTSYHYEKGVRTGAEGKGSFSFAGGVFNNSFDYTSSSPSDPISIKGRFDDAGFMHGTWEFDYLEEGKAAHEIRVYEHGFLLSLVRRASADDDTLMWVSYDHTVEKLKQMAGSNTSRLKRDTVLHDVTFNLGYDDSSREVKAQQTANVLLKESIQKMLFLDTALRTSKQPLFGTARFIHPLTDDDQNDIRLTRAFLDSIRAGLTRLSTMKFLELSSQHSDSLAWSYAWLKAYEKREKKLSAMISFLSGKEYALVDPLIYFSQHADIMRQSDTVYYTYDGEQKFRVMEFRAYPVNTLNEFKRRVLEEMMMAKRMVDYAETELKTVLQSYQLQRLDSIIVNLRDEVETYYSEAEHQDVKALIDIFKRRFLNVEFNRMTHDYSTRTSFDEKLEAGYDILNFLAVLQTYPEAFTQIYHMRDSIADLYTVSQLDPYTFTYVDVKVKKKLYEKAAEELFNHLMAGITRATSLDQVAQQIVAVKRLQSLLVQLRMQNTTKIESQIKSKSTPPEVRQLLGV